VNNDTDYNIKIGILLEIQNDRFFLRAIQNYHSTLRNLPEESRFNPDLDLTITIPFKAILVYYELLTAS
jgi:hypothetical protein